MDIQIQITLFGVCILVMVWAQLKLFSIAKTLKEILEELRQTRRTLYALTTKLAPAAIAPEGTRVDQEKKEFLDLSDRLAATQDPEEQRRLKEELARKAVGG
jgi:hypothetical protein